MRKAAGKRLPHGATLALVMDALLRLQEEGGRFRSVSKKELVDDLGLPATTVDDRLRVLVGEKRVLKVGKGLYQPAPISRWQIPSKPRGTIAIASDDAGNAVRIEWL